MQFENISYLLCSHCANVFTFKEMTDELWDKGAENEKY